MPNTPPAPAKSGNGQAPAPVEDAALKIPESDNDMAMRQLKRALNLEYERGTLLKQINANRELLRYMDEAGELTEEQGIFLDTIYPTKDANAARSDDEIEATRKLREAARKRKVS